MAADGRCGRSRVRSRGSPDRDGGCFSYGLDSTDEEKGRPAHRLERILANDSEGRQKDATVLLRDALALCE